MLTIRSLVLAKVETTSGVDASPVQATDAILVEAPDYQCDPTVLERKFVRPDLSPLPFLIGRKLAKLALTTELRGNSVSGSAIGATPPMVSRLFQGCGYAMSTINVGATNLAYSGPYGDASNSTAANAATVAITGVGGTGNPAALPTFTAPVLYNIICTTGGASGTAQVTVRNNNTTQDDQHLSAPITVTSGTAFVLGATGGYLKMTFAGNLVVGDAWRVLVTPGGMVANPISTGQSSLTLYAYFDGILAKLTYCMGTFKITADAGQYAKITFDFIGQYNAVIDSALPTSPVYEKTLPAVVQLSNFTWGDNNTLVAAQWTYDQANQVVPRPDVNGSDGYSGIRIASRNPGGGFNPEAVLEATDPSWSTFAAAKQKTFFAQLGTVLGNMVTIFGPNAQVSAQKFADRDGIRVYDKTIKFARYMGNDEIEFRWL